MSLLAQGLVDGLVHENDDVAALESSVNFGKERKIGDKEWEPLGPAGLYQNFGPELSFARSLHEKQIGKFAIAKFTDSGSQIVDWTPEGSDQAPKRHVYPRFIDFIKQSIHGDWPAEEEGT